jgi:DNA-binding NarL/FixJ family response regulator
LAKLTPRELEVLALLAEGKTDRVISEEFVVTPKTVEAHVCSILGKLDLPTRTRIGASTLFWLSCVPTVRREVVQTQP